MPITIDGTIAQFSCKCEIHPDLWDIKSNRASGKNTVALETNRFLDKIRVGINAKYKEMAERDNYVIAQKVKNAFLGLEMRHETLLKVFAQHNEDFAKQIDAGLRSQSTYNKYCTVYKHQEEFIKTRYRVSNIALKELVPAFITEFEILLLAEKQCSHNTVWIYVNSRRLSSFYSLTKRTSCFFIFPSILQNLMNLHRCTSKSKPKKQCGLWG